MIFTVEELSNFRPYFINLSYLIPSLENDTQIVSFYLKILRSLALLARDEQNTLLEYNVESLLPIVFKLGDEEKITLYNEIVKACLSQYNAPLLNQFYMLDKDYFQQIRTKLNLKEEENVKLNILLSFDNENDRCELYEVMSQFMDGPGNIITYGGQLTLGQFKHRKSLDMRTTIIEKDELLNYINLLKMASHPLKERFIISGEHWITGQIEIETDGSTQILIMDSLGVDKDKNKFYAKTEKIIETFAEQFSDSKIYLTSETRLHAPAGCSVIAIDDVRHLIHIERYIDEKYTKSGLFGYLADVVDGYITTNNKQTNVICCRLPLTFYRTMQSKTSMEKILQTRSEEINKCPINKRRQTLSDTAYSHFRMHDGDKRNMRVNYILEKFAKHNFKFFHEAKTSSNEFTLEGCKDRLMFIKN